MTAAVPSHVHDDITSLAMLEATVWPAVDGLDEPPGPDEGHVQSVEMDRVRATAKASDCKACQECGEPVLVAEPHVKASVWTRQKPSGGLRQREKLKRPVFCDRECWGDWATR